MEAPDGTVIINGQTVTVTYATLPIGASRQFSIFTTVLEGQDINNTACVRADNSDSEDCVTQSFVSSLPRTGETPLEPTLLVTSIFLLLGGVMMIVHLSITSE